MDFTGKVALVTGSSRNLGVAIAQAFGEAGAAVAVHYSQSVSGAQGVVETIRRGGGSAEMFCADLSSPQGVQQLVHGVQEHFGGIDILVNNVGPYADYPFSELPVEAWDRVMNSGLRAIYLLAQAFAPGMRERGSGSIVNISAGSAFIRVHSVYGLAKAAVLHLTESLALELAPEIRVNAVAPGQIRESDILNEFDPNYIAHMTETTPLKRLVSRREVAGAVCLLCSDFLPSVTGQTLVLDGGWTLPAGRQTPVLNVEA